MLWDNILILITVTLCYVIVYRRFDEAPKDIILTYSFLLLLLVIIQLMILADLAIRELVVEVLHITNLTVAYIILLQTIRYLKSENYRYPYPFVFTPVLILITYPFLYDIEVLKVVIIAGIEGGGLLVLLFLFIYHKDYFKRRIIAYISIALLLLSFILARVVIDDWVLADELWPVALSAGMILFTYSFSYLLKGTSK